MPILFFAVFANSVLILCSAYSYFCSAYSCISPLAHTSIPLAHIFCSPCWVRPPLPSDLSRRCFWDCRRPSVDRECRLVIPPRHIPVPIRYVVSGPRARSDWFAGAVRSDRGRGSIGPRARRADYVGHWNGFLCNVRFR